MSFEMVRAKKIILSKYFWAPTIYIELTSIIYGINYFTAFVQLCWQDAIDEGFRLLIKFVMFGNISVKKQ